MASSILPLDPLMDLTSLTSQTGLFPVKIDAGSEIKKDSGKPFQDSLFTFEGSILNRDQVAEKPLPLTSLLKFQAPLSEDKFTPEMSKEILASGDEDNSPTFPPILNNLIAPPLQKEALAIKETLTSSPLEGAETSLEDDVSMIALSYAMPLQEKETQPLIQKQMLVVQSNATEFSELNSSPSTLPESNLSFSNSDSFLTASDHDRATALEKSPLSQLPQDIEIIPQIRSQDAEVEISAEGKETILPPTVKTSPSTTKQGPLQETKTRDPLTANTSSSSGKENLTAVAQTRTHSEGNLTDRDHDPSHEESEDLNSEDAKNAMSSKSAKTSNTSASNASFSETLSKAPSSAAGSSKAQAELTSLQSGSLEGIEGKDIEEAFHRGSASIDTKATSTQATQQTTSHSSLAQTASLQEQVAFSIKNNAPKGKSEINLQLRPDSLGRLNIKIDINKEGQTFIVVTAERTETRDLLQKDSQQLMELLEQSDLEISDDNMSYSLFNDQERQAFEERREAPADVNKTQEKESPVHANTTTPLISLGMSEIQIPRHGGTWQAIA